MILVDDKQVEALEARRQAEEQEQLNEPPPTYASLQSASSSAEVVAKTVNYVSITRVHNSVKETLIIDPSLFVPMFLRPPLLPGETEETRKNLRLESTHGHVYADVTLVAKDDNANDTDTPKKNKRVVINMKSTHGGITAKIHGRPGRSSFVLHAQAVNGEIRLHIPSSFHGPVIVSHRHGFVRFSDAISRNLTTFGEVDSTRRCFLGDFSRWSESGDGWAGDELVVEVRHGNVKIHYDDDAVGSPVKTRPTLLNRIFGF
ncbi:hypothetical protein CPB84DRAFT_162980 [Gymnopilus junonius]|uniref:DUF7330 domain-containing protein n=1 Tax=Gymnopilus junonius TaxID=109634 RepID=A0A9P5NVX4_GYMJU|nr:hypothetical protein CPB84DRAFT_162980 [Gymnopilus junonius]